MDNGTKRFPEKYAYKALSQAYILRKQYNPVG